MTTHILKNRLANLTEKIASHKKRIIRQIEYNRLKRIRKKTRPKYKYCKNCGTELKGMYCHKCGQYALDTEQPFWKYILQYFENVYQFDSKVWTTIWMLFRRPGFLTTEFNAGKIVSYVHPMRLLMFITVIFFLFFFIFINSKINSVLDKSLKTYNETFILNDLSYEDTLTNNILNGLDLSLTNSYDKSITETGSECAIAIVADSSTISNYSNIIKIIDCSPDMRKTETLIRKDTLSVMINDNILLQSPYIQTGQWKNLPLYEIKKGYKASLFDKITMFKEHLIGFISSYSPLISLLLIPLMALMLKSLYRKSNIFYMGHFVFSLHFASFFFIILAVYIIIGELWHYNGMTLNLFLLAIYLYTSIASHWVYKTGWIKAIVKSIILISSYALIVFIILAILLGILIYMEIDVLDPALAMNS